MKNVSKTENSVWERPTRTDYDAPMAEEPTAIVTGIAGELNLNPRYAAAALSLLDEGATVPFVARYRKEATGGMDEVALIALRDAAAAARELEKRRESILASLAERDLLTTELENQIREAATKTALEDAYLPWRPKRKTRAAAAREAGYEPLARQILRHQDEAPRLEGFEDPEAALAGARDILAEQFNEDPKLRASLRLMTAEEGLVTASVVAKKKNDEGAAVFRDYFEYEESVARIPSHRILAVLRGQR